MKGKYKLTRFAKSIIFLAMISPACYLAGIQYQDSLDIFDLKDRFNIVWTFDTSTDNSELELEKTEDLQEQLQENIEDLKEEIQDLENDLNEKELELKELRFENKEA